MRVFARTPTPVWGLLLLLATLSGLGLGFRSALREHDRLKRLQAQHQALRSLAATAANNSAELESFAGGALPELSELLAAYLPTYNASSETASADTSFGYRLRTASVRLEEVPWTEIRRLIETAESQQPPWRLTRIELRAGLDGLAGELHFQGLDKQTPQQERLPQTNQTPRR